MTQEAFAKRLGISRATLNRLEKHFAEHSNICPILLNVHYWWTFMIRGHETGLCPRQAISQPLDRILVTDGAEGNAVQPVVKVCQINVRQTAVVLNIHFDLKAEVVH